VECIRQSLAASGGTLEARTVANAPAYVVKEADGRERTFLAFGGPNVLVLAGTEAWIGKARDPAAAKLSGQGDMMGLVHRTDTRKAVWVAGHVPESIGRAILSVTSGIVTSAPVGGWGHFEAGSRGLDLEGNLEMASDQDARGLVEFTKKQLEELIVVAQTQGLGPQVAKIQLAAAGKVARLSLKLNADELAELEAKWNKEGATP
jgi:hypothetical protein